MVPCLNFSGNILVPGPHILTLQSRQNLVYRHSELVHDQEASIASHSVKSTCYYHKRDRTLLKHMHCQK